MSRTRQQAAPHATYSDPPATQRLRNAACSGALVATAAVAGSIASRPNDEWYRTLDKPAWQPPPIAFPIVWTALYADIAGTSAAVLSELERRGDHDGAAQHRKALATNMALNAAWSWLFFRWHNLPAATFGAGVLALSSIRLAKRASRVDPRFGRLLAPYAAWTSFATVLAGVVWSRNRDRET